MPRNCDSFTVFPFSSCVVKSGALSFTFMTPYSYRKTRRFVTVLAILAFSFSLCAQPSRRDQPVLRGTAVLESAGVGWRLIPVCIYSGGKFYDADFYQATPAPMSLIYGTIYEVQRAGTPIGNYTVKEAVRVGSVWYGTGEFDDFSKKKSGPSRASSPEDDRPVLRKSPPRDNTPPAAQTPEQPNGASASTPPKDQTDLANNDPSRPTLKRGAQPAPAPESKDEKAPTKPAQPAKREFRVAISDPAQPQSRPFVYAWDDTQKAKITADLKKLAAAELQKQARSRGVTLAPKDKIEFADFQASAFDVDYSNNPQVVATAKFIPTIQQLGGLTPASQSTITLNGITVTLVGRVNYDGQLERIYGEVSDPRNLDDDPVMELVDAADVDSDNRAELIFILHGDGNRRFVVYRLYGLSMKEIFRTATR